MDLFDIEIEGVPVWETARFGVYRRIRKENFSLGEAHNRGENSAIDYTKIMWHWSRNAFYRNPYYAGNHKILVWGHPRRKKHEDGNWWDIYCDPIYDALDLDVVHIEHPYQDGHLTPAKTEEIKYLDLIEYTGQLLRKFDIIDVELSEKEKTQFKRIEQEILDRFEVNLDLIDWVEFILTQRRSIRKLYKRLLRRINPKLAVLVSSYGKETFVETCQDLGITVAELQHGVIHPQHFGYAYPGSRTKERFPDYLLTFGEYWKDAVEYPISEDRVIPVGYPYLENEIDRYLGTESQDQIVFLSQGPVGEEFSQVAVQLAEYDGFDYDIVYKLHPGEYNRWREEYPWLIDTNLEVVDGSGRALYQLFAESNAQIGVGSTAVYEGLAFDLETYIYDLPGSSVLQPLIKDGSASKVTSVDELASSIGDGQDVSFDKDYYFSPRPIDRIDDVVEKLKDF